MDTVIIVIHLIVVLALVGVVLIQRSEGGGLGIGGGSGFMTARGTANALTRTTAILAALFFATSLALSVIARYGEKPTDILDRVPQQTGQQDGGGLLNQLGGGVSGKAAAPEANGGATAPAVPQGSNATEPAAQQAPATAPAATDGKAAGPQDAAGGSEAQPATPASPVPSGQ